MEKRSVIIVGAGKAGEEVKRIIDGRLDIQLIGFVDDDRPARSTAPILGTISELPSIVKRHYVSEVIVAIPSASGDLIRTIVQSTLNLPVMVRIVPRLSEIVLGRVHPSLIRPVQPEDLVGRTVVQKDVRKLAKAFSGRCILITGGAGSIGSEITKQLLYLRPKQVVMYDWSENRIFQMNQYVSELKKGTKVHGVIGSILDSDKLSRICQHYRVNDVIHAAAYKHVPLMEEFPEEAVRNNIFGTQRVLAAAKDSGVKRFLLISTDKAVNPFSVMGASKYIAESLTLAADTKDMHASAVRFVNVVGSEGSVVPLFEAQIRNGGPVTVTHPDMVRYLMTPQEAAQLTLSAMAIMKGGERFMLEMGEPIKIVDLAQLLIRLHGLRPNVDIQVKYTGIRPGEKLAEELSTNSDAFRKTAVPGIWEMVEKTIPKSRLMRLTNTLEKVPRSESQRLRSLLLSYS